MTLLNRRNLLRDAVLLAAALPAFADAGFNFFLSEFTVSRDELQTQIARRFPVRQRYAEIFTVTLRDPQLALDGRAMRARITAHLGIENPLLEPREIDGIVSISSALAYDGATRTLRLDRPRAERLELRGLAGHDAERLQQIGALVAQQLLQGYALYTFRANELTVGRKTYAIGAITIEDAQIRVELQ